MFCTQCGADLRDQDSYCAQCGRRAKPELPLAASERLTRDMSRKKIAGVCSGLARYMNVDPVLVRLIFLVLALSTGIGFIAYIVGWIVMPKEPVLMLPAATPGYGPAMTVRNP